MCINRKTSFLLLILTLFAYLCILEFLLKMVDFEKKKLFVMNLGILLAF